MAMPRLLLCGLLVCAGCDTKVSTIDPTGDADSDTFVEEGQTPLAHRITTLVDVNETTWLLPGISQDWLGLVTDDMDAATPGAELGHIVDPMQTDQTNGRLLAATHGDVDGDGRPELVVLSVSTERENTSYRFDYLHVTIFDDAQAGFAVLGTITREAFDEAPLNPEVDSFLMGDLALGNLDDDEALEIVVTGSYGRIPRDIHAAPYQYASVVYAFDDLGAGLARLHKDVDVGVNVRFMHVALGDLDGDDRDEILVTGVDGTWPKAWLLDDHLQGYERLHQWNNLGDGVFEQGIRNPNVACGDVDGDGLDEAVFGATNRPYDRLQVRVYDDVAHEYVQVEGKYIEASPSRTWNPDVPLQLGVGDIDGNGRDDVIVAVHDNYSNQDRGWTLYYFRPDQDDSGLLGNTMPSSHYESATNGYLFGAPPGGLHLSVGDVDRDRLADVVAVSQRYQFVAAPDPFGVDETVIPGFVARRWELDNGAFIERDSWTWDLPEPLDYGSMVRPLVTLGDVDGDNTTVRYTGEHWLAMSEPRIVVAMAMPPGWAQIPQDNVTNTWVGYGQVRDVSQSESNEISVSAAVTLSVEAGDPFGIVSANASVSLKQELTKTETTTSTISTGVKRVGNWAPDELDDFVIYVATEYHRYQYAVVSHDDPAKIGERFTLDVPLETNTFKKTVSAFNEQNGEFRDIGPETFGHTVGDPTSYPTTEDRDALLQTWTGWRTPAVGAPLYTVGETAAGGTEVFISMSDEHASAEARTLGVETSAGFAVGGVGVESSVGVSSTAIYEIAVAESTEYVGSVGDIPSSHYAQWEYGFGMFVYNFERDDGAKYQVINWCVQP